MHSNSSKELCAESNHPMRGEGGCHPCPIFEDLTKLAALLTNEEDATALLSELILEKIIGHGRFFTSELTKYKEL